MSTIVVQRLNREGDDRVIKKKTLSLDRARSRTISKNVLNAFLFQTRVLIVYIQPSYVAIRGRINRRRGFSVEISFGERYVVPAYSPSAARIRIIDPVNYARAPLKPASNFVRSVCTFSRPYTTMCVCTP